MAFSFSYFRAARFAPRRVSAWPLGALLFAAAAPVRAQNAPSTAAPVPTAPSPGASGAKPPLQAAPAPQPIESKTPKLTMESRPTSSISASRRPVASRAPQDRSLVMAEPENHGAPAKKTPASNAATAPLAAQVSAPLKTPAVAPQKVTQQPFVAPQAATLTPVLAPATPSAGVISESNAAPQTLISPAKPVKVTSKTRFAASRVSTQSSSLTATTASATAPNGATPGQVVPNGLIPNVPNAGSVKTGVTPIDPAQHRLTSDGAPLLALAPPLSASATASAAASPTTSGFSPRDQMARLPSRGGLASNRAPIELQPKTPTITPPESGAISEQQRRMLAELDADLGRAQRRLDRAETGLTQGQQQLGAFTGVLRTAMLDAGDDARGLHPFVRVAQRYMGTPYVWGGESARGFDCSGFIMRVMRDLGYQALPHSAAEQFHYGLPVAKALLKPGDIVFFANTYKPGVSHVGIYLGRGRFIHAANSKVGTIVSSLNEPKWVEHYAGARRLLAVKS